MPPHSGGMEITMKKTFKLEGLCCAHCAAHIEEEVRKIDGIESAAVTFVTQKLTATFEESGEREIIKKISKTVRRIEPDVELSEI